MSLRACKDCGYRIGQSSAICPQCGAKNPRQARGFTVFIFAVFLVAMIYQCGKDEMAKQGVDYSAATNTRHIGTISSAFP